MRLFLATMMLTMMPRRAAAAFCARPAAISAAFTTTTTTRTTRRNNNKGLRRRRAPESSDSLQALMEQDPRLFYDGALKDSFCARSSTTTTSSSSTTSLFASSVQETEVSTTEETTSSSDNDVDVWFPLQGKNVEDCPPRMRFAPSPTGSLHVGGARTALYNWLVAKRGQLDFNHKGDGGFIVRVEDTDLARSTKESEASVLADLKWLGLTWDEGPDDAKAAAADDDHHYYGPYRQSERSELYKKVAQRLLDEGKAYPCFCTQEELEEMREQQEAEGIPPRYDNRWRDADPEVVKQKLAEGVPHTIRFKVPAGARVVIDDLVRGTVSWDAESTVGDFILLRSGDGVPVYNFCVAVDDATMGITTVVRAEEHLTNTLRQGLILDALGAPRPRYAHCSLILGEDKQKLSKRHGATSCDQFRLDGFLPDAMINYLALLGWNDGSDNEIFTREELIDAFDLDRVVKSPSVFDMEKLKWVNSQHMKAMSIEELVGPVKEQFEWEHMLVEGADAEKVDKFVFSATALAKQMMETTKDAALNAKTVLGYGLPASFEELSKDDAKDMIEQGNFYNLAMELVKHFEAGDLPQPDPVTADRAFVDSSSNKGVEEDRQAGDGDYAHTYKQYMKALAKTLSLKGKVFFHPLRLALTGEMSGQDVAKQLSLLAMANDGDVVTSNVVVPLSERMVRLKAFCDTIPEEFRAPQKKEGKKKQPAQDQQQQAASATAPAGAAAAEENKSDPWVDYTGPPITALDIRVGKILKVWEHEEADKLYCEEIDVGEDEPRQIASGLRPFLTPDEMEGRHVLVLCNLKSRKLVGFPSHGMVLCASNADHTEVRLVAPPVDAKIGERVTVAGVDFSTEEAAPFAENKVGKKKVVEKLAPYLVTSEYGVPEFLGRPFMTSAGVCTSPIPEGSVS